MRTMLPLFLLFLAAAGQAGDTASPAPMKLPFECSFPGDAIGLDWQARASEGASLSARDGWLVVDAPVNAVAHIERPLEHDNVTASVRITNFASLYLIWGPDRWCSFGKNAVALTGRFESAVACAGRAVVTPHSASIPWNAYHVRVVLGRDVIRFEFSIDAKEWFAQRVMERPASLSGPPALIAVGRTYAPDANPFGSPDASYKPASARQTCSVTDARVEQTPTGMLQMTQAERKELGQPPAEPVARAMREARGDPAYDVIAKYYPPFRYPRELAGVPEHPLAIGVDWLGRLDSSPSAPVAWFTLGETGEPLGREDTVFKRRLLDGWIPAVTLTASRDSVRYEMTVFGWSQDFSPDSPLWGYVSLQATALPGGKLPSRLAFAGPGGSTALEPASSDGGSSVVVRLRYKHPDASSAQPVDAAEFDAKLSAAATMWRQRIAPAALFSVPDKRVSEAYRAWLAYSMLNSKMVNGFVELHDGSGFYDMVYGYSMSLYAIATDVYSLPRLSERLLDTQLHFQSPDGLYTQEAGLPDHGAMLLSLAHHYELTRDTQWLRRVAPGMIKACEWVVRQRDAAPKEGLTKGLIKFRPYCDYFEAVFSYFGNTYCCVGLEQCAKALSDIGAPEAARFAAEGARFRRDILASMDAAVIQHDGMAVLPVEPDTQRLLRDSNYRGGDYYGLVASCVLETGFLAPRDRRALLITDMLEKRGGLIAGVSEFMEGIDHAYAFGYLTNQMCRDNVREVLLGFWSMLAFGMTRDTYSPVELTMIATGDNNLTLPHSYSCTQQLRLLRNMLVLEEGDTLWIMRATPQDWLRPSRSVAAQAAPTAYGPVTFKVSRLSDGTARVQVTPPGRAAVKTLKIRLRVPGGRSITAVSARARGVSFAGDVVTVTAPEKQLDLTVRFK